MTDFSRFMLLVSLVLSPWCYGSTRPGGVQFIITLLLPSVLLWLVSLQLGHERIHLPRTALASCIALLCLGWFMAVNARFMFDWEFAKFAATHPFLPFLPGSYDGPASRGQMLRITALVGAIAMAADLVQSREWRLRLWWTVALTGISICLLGLVQKLGGAPMIFWEQGRNGYFFFGTYLYHGNAGAYINLVLPWVILLTLRSFQQDNGPAKALLVPGMMICLAAAFSHASKAAMVITVLMLISIFVAHFSALRSLFHRTSKVTRLVALVLIPLSIAAVAVSVGWRLAAQRWEFFEISKSIRIFAYDICMQAAADAGWFGFGPGTFGSVFDVYALKADPGLDKMWRHAHQDYLQAVIEWGWFGATLIAVLFLGAMVSLWIGARRFNRRGENGKACFLGGTLIALAGVALHALVDFPLQIFSLQLLAAVYVGVGWGSLTWFRREVRGRRKRVHVSASDDAFDENGEEGEIEEPVLTQH